MSKQGEILWLKLSENFFLPKKQFYLLPPIYLFKSVIYPLVFPNITKITVYLQKILNFQSFLKMSSEKINPYKEKEAPKTEQVAEMFDNISGKYDFLNHFFSLGIDKIWRNKVRNIVKNIPNSQILDVATGTGDLAIALSKIPGTNIIGVDISNKMLEVGRQKVLRKKLEGRVDLRNGDSLRLPFEENQFDAVTVAFGVRNFENISQGLSEISRVLKPNGKIIVLEFSNPRKFPIKQLFNFYSRKLMPSVGKLVSKDSRAYSYLPESVQAFPTEDKFAKIIEESGFVDATYENVSGGIAAIHVATKN
jgi:demethylmenaquinone methyltransferase/2-methoxy-6-polyprenyl-1,4-benzoquinol methylase